MEVPYREKVKNLGKIAPMVIGPDEPDDIQLLWYDTNIKDGCPIKYYNLSSEAWIRLV